MIDRLLSARTVEAELRAAKDAAEKTNRAKSEFLSNMSHELRTPLNSVIGFANIILKNKNKTLSEQDIAYMSRIVANGKHLLGLINGILDLSKIEAGRVELEIAPVNAGELVNEIVLELEGQTTGRDIALSAIVEDDIAVFDADRSKLKQVLINLVGNALKFTQQGSVVVRVARDESTGRPSRIDVIDTGVGIPADRLEAVFEAFQQADNTTSRQFGGTGLGLTITRSLAQMMGFDIRVTSEVGKGSTFSVIIEEWSAERANALNPAPVVVEAKAAAPAVAGKGSKKRALALIVDDDPDSRSVLSHHLRSLGCDVATARGADEGIAIARKLKPDLITLDVMMPRKSGVEALHDFQTDPVLRHIPIVLVSVVAEEHRGRVFGVADFVEKPVTSEVLHDVLDRTVPHLALTNTDAGAQ
jgi:CheY-like chemotaxis protein/nitrogen-specific signal transduction histidine kinase